MACNAMFYPVSSRNIESCAAMHRFFYDSRVVDADMRDIFSRRVDWKDFYGRSFLITGATGMIASYLTLFLIWLNEEHGAGISVTAMVRNKEKCEKLFGGYCRKEYFHIFRTDLCDPDMPDGKYDYIIHTASPASGNYYITNPVEVILPNCIGTYKLLEFAKTKGIKGFLLFSSGAVYGKIADTNIHAIKENTVGQIDPLDPHSCYDESKRISETLCVAYFKEYGLETKIVRMAHTYSPMMDFNSDPRVFASLLKSVVENKDMELRSSGESKREFCYITDAVAAYFIVLQRGMAGEAYNISNMWQFYTINDFAETVRSLDTDYRFRIRPAQNPENKRVLESKTAADIPQDNHKAVSLGCEFKISVGEGMARCLEFFKENGSIRKR